MICETGLLHERAAPIAIGGRLIELLARLRDIRLVRYGLASIGALAVDMGFFLLLLAGGMSSPLAAAAGYSLGIIVHWLMSSRAVFQDSVAQRGAGRGRQKVLFVASALIGLALTTGIVWAGERSGVDPRLAKMAAILVSFLVTYLLRKTIVFSRALP
ncbi:GtrA family protein [Qipengyuania nanhaisediminis]|uniref:Putative flippase GtrA (Transmembrane translocase of bactoprenol-linked glucose) n=1 Tax=Qipengyuania nanhaisediminis TaxID=604088 RepID=A0A1I5KR06_9SPHN|nr:GtrA family protein [Qipengyuania nanhaisediminis]SFO87076.1 Putative flippase GtrA (transmembrane translocase of bactoprenol-linked glucose) [Qipengyuania nanhaisediminis]